jgi:hypothetical protein
MSARNLKLGLSVFVLTIALMLLVAEIGLRFIPGYSFRPEPRILVGERANRPSRHFLADSLIGWRMVASIDLPDTNLDGATAVYHSNERGFRRPDSLAAHSRSDRTIVLVGDSFTFGVGLDYGSTFAGLAEHALSGTRVVNLAMPGFGMDQMWMTVRHYALPLRPALIVVGFIDDDFDRSLTAYRQFEGMNKPTFVVDDGRLRKATPADRASFLTAALDHHSSLWALGRVVARRLAYSRPVGDWWTVNRTIIDSLSADCERAGAHVVFVRIPARGTRPRFQVLRNYMTKAGHPLIDLADPTHVPPEIFFPRDGHINAAGHRYVADSLVAWIGANPAVLSRTEHE